MWRQRVLKPRDDQNSSPPWSQITFSKRFESESYLRSRGIGRMGIGKDEVEGKRRGRKGIETGNGGGSIDCVARSEALPSHRWVDRWTHGYVLQVLAKSRPLPWSRRNASSAISSYRYRQSGGKGHHHFFYVPHSGHVEHCRGFCFPSLSRAPLIDVSIRVSSKLPPISPSTNYLMINGVMERNSARFFSSTFLTSLSRARKELRSLDWFARYILRSVSLRFSKSF